MLTLTRKLLQTIDLYDRDTGKTTSVMVVKIGRGQVRLGIVAHESVEIARRELTHAAEQEERRS